VGAGKLFSATTLLAVATAVGGITVATATIPDGGGVIHGCYSTLPPTGQLRVIDTDKPRGCARNEKPLDWNERGPVGATGPAGPTGATGHPGTSEGWFKRVQGTAPIVPGYTYISLSLPAGTFMVTLTGEAVDEFGGDGKLEVQCTSLPAGLTAAAFVTGQVAALADANVVSFGAPGSIDLSCLSTSGADSLNVELSAIQLDRAHVE